MQQPFIVASWICGLPFFSMMRTLIAVPRFDHSCWLRRDRLSRRRRGQNRRRRRLGLPDRGQRRPRRLYCPTPPTSPSSISTPSKVVGDIPDTPGVHGIAIAPELNRGFISNGRGNNVTIFDLKTLKTIGTAATGENPDSIRYDAGLGARVRLQRPLAERDRDRREDGHRGRRRFRCPASRSSRVADGTGQDLRQHRGHERDRRRSTPPRRPSLKRLRAHRMRGPSGLAIDAKNRRAVLGLRQPRDGDVRSRRRQGDRDAGHRRRARTARRSIPAPATRSARTATAR